MEDGAFLHNCAMHKRKHTHTHATVGSSRAAPMQMLADGRHYVRPQDHIAGRRDAAAVPSPRTARLECPSPGASVTAPFHPHGNTTPPASSFIRDQHHTSDATSPLSQPTASLHMVLVTQRHGQATCIHEAYYRATTTRWAHCACHSALRLLPGLRRPARPEARRTAHPSHSTPLLQRL